MVKRAAFVLTLAIWPALASAGFRDVVRTIEQSSGIRRIYIPFMGMARTFVRVVEPDGLSDFRLAVFEGRGRDLPGNFDDVLRAAAGPGWQPIVRMFSRREGERCLILARPAGRAVRLMIVARERDEAAVIELEIDARRLSRLIHDIHHGPFTTGW